MEKDEIIRERIERYGVNALMNYEALSLLTNIKMDTLIHFNNLIEVQKNIHKLEITSLQALKLQALFELIERFPREKSINRKKVNSPSIVYELMAPKMKHLHHEEFYIILLDTKCQIIETKCISKGSLTNSIIHPREVLKPCIEESAHSFIAIHNHPSGNTEPSKEDIKITNRLKECGDLVGISLLDHVIIGDGYNSLKESGYM